MDLDIDGHQNSTSKLIRRQDLDSQSSSSDLGTHDAAIEDRFREQLNRFFEHGDTADRATIQAPSKLSPSLSLAKGEESYNFRLFARPPEAANTTVDENRTQDHQRITLKSPSPVNREPGFLCPHRPQDYYVAREPSVHHLEQFREAAISGDCILEGLKMNWPGSKLPWRVTVIKSTNSKQKVGVTLPETIEGKNRKRVGKKRRIAIRKKFAAQSTKEAASRQNRAEKEAADREKRTRKNREKKIKKRQKERLRKSQGVPDAS